MPSLTWLEGKSEFIVTGTLGRRSQARLDPRLSAVREGRSHRLPPSLPRAFRWGSFLPGLAFPTRGSIHQLCNPHVRHFFLSSSDNVRADFHASFGTHAHLRIQHSPCRRGAEAWSLGHSRCLGGPPLEVHVQRKIRMLFSGVGGGIRQTIKRPLH